jgi:hypothetical protein
VKLILSIPWVRRQPRSQVIAAADDVERSGREDVAVDLSHLERRQGRERGGFEHHSVPGKQRRCGLQKA